MKNTIQSVKGTRDYYPEEMAIRNYLYSSAHKVSESFGYQEYEGPFLESIDLYAAKSGDELVKEQSFVFPDRGGDLITLRPELTPTLARMVAQRQRQLIYPLRWWSWGPFWRYERPQKGRTREFFQWNIDLIGVDSPEADAEILAIAATFLQEIGLISDQAHILVNHRGLMDAELHKLDVPPDKRSEVFRVIDRRDKMPPKEWEANAIESGLTDRQFDGLLKILSNNNLWRNSRELVRIFELLGSLDVSRYVQFAPNIIRGLDYYTGMVFEVWDRDGEFRAILGGGRYDNLVADVGGDKLPAVGFAMGDLVISLVLRKFDRLPNKLGDSPAKILIISYDEVSIADSFRIASMLRDNGLAVACYPEITKLPKQFKYADRMGMQIALIIGPEERAAKKVSIKKLTSGEQTAVNESELLVTLRRFLETETAS